MILFRASWRYLLRHPWQNLLALLGIALGVGVVTAVDLANGNAVRAFQFAATALAGTTTHTITGNASGLDENLYRRIRVDLGVRPSAPVIDGYLTLPDRNTSLHLIGIDPFAEASLRTFTSNFSDRGVLRQLLSTPDTVLLLPETAGRLGLSKGQTITVQGRGKRQLIRLIGYLTPESDLTRTGLQMVAVADIATAQELLGLKGKISRIDLLIAEDQKGADTLKLLRENLPQDAHIQTTGARSDSLAQMTKAFRLNLTALSLLALVVGMFLIYNTTTFSVIRRRRFIGLLRAIGATRQQIFLLVFLEVALLGIVGTAGGILFGVLLGNNLTHLVTRTINDLYFVMAIQAAQIVPASLIKGSLLGLGTTFLAAVPPLKEATTATPRKVLSRSTIEAHQRRAVPRAAMVGATLLAIAGVTFSIPSWGLAGGFTGLFLLIIGYTLFVPAIVVLLSPYLRHLLFFLPGPLGKMAARGVTLSLSRTAVATAALVVAVSAGIGVGIMVDSFRLTVAHWLDSWLRADVYVTSAGTGSGRGKPPLGEDVVNRLRWIPGVAFTSLTRRISLETAEGPVDLLAMELPRETYLAYTFKEGGGNTSWTAFNDGTAVIVSEPYAYRHNLHLNDHVTLPTAIGSLSLPIAGIFYNYGSDVGMVAISRRTYIKLWHDESVDGIGFYTAPGTDDRSLTVRIRNLIGSRPLEVVANHEIKKRSLAIFDRTFAITGILRMVTVIVAFVGIVSAFMAIQVERVRELATIRALGLTPKQVCAVICGETTLLGVLTGLQAIPLGIVQALVLIRVINLRSFGWTIDLFLDPSLLLQAFALAILAALIAGIYPAIIMARTSPALALKEEEA